MAMVAPLVRRDDASPDSNNRIGRWLKAVVFCAIIVFLYGRVLVDLAVDWWTIPSQSQGLIIPPLAIFLAWERRHRTLASPASPDSMGLPTVALACIMFLVGKMGAEFFLMRSSFVLLLVGA